jgi:hypothetical protein
MDCPVCQWPLKLERQWEAQGFACGTLRCNDCQCAVTVKAPMSKMAHRWPKELSS